MQMKPTEILLHTCQNDKHQKSMGKKKKSINKEHWQRWELRETLYTVGGNVNWWSHWGKTVVRFLNKLKIELPYDPAVQLLSTDSKKAKTLIWKDICSPMFRAASFTKAKIWKQPVVGWMNKVGWIKMVSYTQTQWNTTSHQKEWKIAIWSNVDELGGHDTKWNKSDK